MADRYDDHDRRRARVGALLILVIGVVATAVFFLDALVRITTEGPHITVMTQSAPGVEPGTAVWVAGRDVGRVLSVEFKEPTRGIERIEVVAVLERGVERFIRADATVNIQPGALLEPVVVVIHPGSPNRATWDLDVPFTTTNETVDPEALVEMGAALRASGDSLRGEAERLRSAIRRGGGSIALLADNPDVLREAGSTMEEAAEVLTRDLPHGNLGRLAADTLIAARLARIRERLATLDTLGTRDRAIQSFEETSAAMEAFENRLLALSDRLDSGEGSAGRWLRDGEIGQQLGLLRARIDSMSVELARYPDRWLRVKVF